MIRLASLLVLVLIPAAGLRAQIVDDPLPPGAARRLGTTRLQHPGGINDIVFARDGRHIASVSDDHLCLWDAKTGERLRLLESDRERYQALAYSPDGKLLAVGVGGLSAPILIWDAMTLKELRRIEETHSDGGVCHLIFAPDSNTLYSNGHDGRLRLWDPRTGKAKGELKTHATGWFGQFALARDGRSIAWGTQSGEIHVWDLEKNQAVRVLRKHASYVTAVAFSPDGATLASVSHHDETFRIWDLATGKERHRRHGEMSPSACRSVAFSSDGKTLYAAERDVLHFLDAATGKEQLRIEGRTSGDPYVILSPDGKTIAVASTQAIHLWDTTGKPLSAQERHDGGVNALAFAPDGKTLITGSGDAAVRIWDPRTGKLLRTLTGHAHGVNGVSVSSDGRLIASVADHDPAMLWNATNGKKKLNFHQGSSYALSVALSPDGQALVCAGYGHSISFFETRTGWQTFIGRRQGEGPILGGDRGPRMPSSHDGETKAVAFSPDGKRVASGSADRSVRIWDAATGFQLRRLDDHPAEVNAVAFSPDGYLLAAGSQKSVSVWHVPSGKRLLVLDDPAREIRAVAFSPDGRSLAAGGSNWKVQVWEIFTAQECRSFDGHKAWTTALAFSPDGKQLASGSYDCSVLLWNAYPTTKAPDAKDMEKLWALLAADSAKQAHEAMSLLIAAPKPAVAQLREKLRPADASSVKTISDAIVQLDSANFAKREQAARTLEEQGASAVPGLRKVLAGAPSLEVRRRIEQILDQPHCLVKSAEQRRVLRALTVLEQIGTNDALNLLETLAKGEALAMMTQEAEAARRRLANRANAEPRKDTE